MKVEPDAGPATSERYEGERGRQYYEDFQRESARRGARLMLPTFAPHVSETDRVVDFGCGGGWLLELLPARQKIGVEVNPVARQDARGRGLDVRESLHRLDDATADVVISNHALEHTLQPFEHLREIHRVLVPGGRLVLHLPVGDWRTERRVNPDDINGHLYSWTSQNIYNLLTEAGFVDVEPHVVTFAWPPYAHRLARIPALYRVTGTAWSVLRRIRELRTTATKPA